MKQVMQARTGVPFRLFERLCGLGPNDEFVTFLSEISGRPVPSKYRRQRGQLTDAMLDAHFHIGGRKLAIAAEPDLLFDLSSMLHEMGAQVSAAVTTTQSAVIERIKTKEVLIGDLEDLEELARTKHCDLLITHSHDRPRNRRQDLSLDLLQPQALHRPRRGKGTCRSPAARLGDA